MNNLSLRTKIIGWAQRSRNLVKPSPFQISAGLDAISLRGPHSSRHDDRKYKYHVRPKGGNDNGSTEAAGEDAEASWDQYCLPAYVTVVGGLFLCDTVLVYFLNEDDAMSQDNKKNAKFTVMEIEVQDYPGLMRVIAWVLNGLGLYAQNAILSTSSEGVAHNTLWLCTRSGKKLRDEAADLLADRVREYLTYCSPRPGESSQMEFSTGPISVSNCEHSQYTVITIREKRRTPGFLLEVASILSGLNVQVSQGVIQGCGSTMESALEDQLEPCEDEARLLKFWVRNQQSGQKLNAAEVRALLYALGIGLGFSGQRFPLSPPNRDISILSPLS